MTGHESKADRAAAFAVHRALEREARRRAGERLGWEFSAPYRTAAPSPITQIARVLRAAKDTPATRAQLQGLRDQIGEIVLAALGRECRGEIELNVEFGCATLTLTPELLECLDRGGR